MLSTTPNTSYATATQAWKQRYQTRDVSPLAKGTILVADDSKPIQTLVGAILKNAGYEVDCVSTGLGVLKKIKNQHYDIILMDGTMPELDGWAATQKIRQLNCDEAHIPIIALTGHIEAGAKEHFMEIGMDDYISKPITASKILPIVNKWLHLMESQHTSTSKS